MPAPPAPCGIIERLTLPEGVLDAKKAWQKRIDSRDALAGGPEAALKGLAAAARRAVLAAAPLVVKADDVTTGASVAIKFFSDASQWRRETCGPSLFHSIRVSPTLLAAGCWGCPLSGTRPSAKRSAARDASTWLKRRCRAW